VMRLLKAEAAAGFVQVRSTDLANARPEALTEFLVGLSTRRPHSDMSVGVIHNFDSHDYEWLRHCLAPMQDGVVWATGVYARLERCILLFASHQHRRFSTFRAIPSATDRAGARKLPDFVSRLRGHFDDADPAAFDDADKNDTLTVAAVTRVMAECLCELIANNPMVLQDIEWRDLERVVARALESLGFAVRLTPGARDGGKDVVVRCAVDGAERVFFVEIKHWRCGDRPGWDEVSHFVQVNGREATDGGLFLSSSGFTGDVHCQVAELTRQRIRLGDQEKIVSLCQYYIQEKSGLWHQQRSLPQVLFEGTLDLPALPPNMAEEPQ